MNSFQFLDGYFSSLSIGMVATVVVAAAAQIIAIFFGIAGAALKASQWPYSQSLVNTYVRVVRGVPDMAWVFLAYFGGEQALNAALRYCGYQQFVAFNGTMVGSLCLGAIYGAYNVETFYGAYHQLPCRQVEAALVSGLGPFATFFHVIGPQVLALCMPGALANWLNLFKATSVLSLINVDEVVRAATNAGNATKQPFKFWIAVVVFYLSASALSKGLTVWFSRSKQAERN